MHAHNQKEWLTVGFQFFRHWVKILSWLSSALRIWDLSNFPWDWRYHWVIHQHQLMIFLYLLFSFIFCWLHRVGILGFLSARFRVRHTLHTHNSKELYKRWSNTLRMWSRKSQPTRLCTFFSPFLYICFKRKLVAPISFYHIYGFFGYNHYKIFLPSIKAYCIWWHYNVQHIANSICQDLCNNLINASH